MKKFNFLTKKPKSNYVLEVVDTTTPKTVKRSKVRGGFSHGKKAISAFILGAIMVVGTAGGAMAVNMAPEKADAALFDSLNPAYYVCSTKDTPGAYLGGTSDSLKSSFKRETHDSPVGNGLNVTINSQQDENEFVDGNGRPKAGQRWTALEQYGYYAPSFETWQGALYEDKYDGAWPFYGTGGSGNTTSYGQLVAITDASQSPMFSNDLWECLNVDGSMNAGFGNFVFGITKLGVAIASESYGIASTMDITSESSPLNGLATGVTDMITGGDNPSQGLKQLLFLDWLIGVIFIATIGLIYVGLVKKSSMQAGQGAVWMIGATIAGFMFLSNPLLVPGMVDRVVGDFSSAVTKAIIPSDSNSTNLCKVDATGSAASVRQVKCSIWYSTIYTPWVQGQFGVDEYDMSRVGNDTSALGANEKQAIASASWMYNDGYKATRAGATSTVGNWDAGKKVEGDGYADAVDANPGSANTSANSRGILNKADIKFGDRAYDGNVNWAIYMLDRQNDWEKNTGVDYSEIALNQLAVNNNTQWAKASDAIGSSMMSILAAAGPVTILLALSLTMIGYQISMLFLIAFSPLLFLAGVAPGWGRRIAMRWFELVVGLLIKRVILTIFLVLFIRLYMLVVQADIDWWVQALIALVLSMVAMSQRDKITNIFSSAINFGGDKRLDAGGQVGQQLKRGTLTAATKSARLTNVAARKSAPLVARGAGAVKKAPAGLAGASVRGATALKNAPAKMDEVVAKRELKKDNKAKIGLQSSEERQKTMGKVNAETYAFGKNTTIAERRQMGRVGRDGKITNRLDRKKAEEFVESKKKSFVTKDQQLVERRNQAIEKKRVAKEALRSKTMKPQEARAQRKEANTERKEIRKEAKELQKSSVKHFGKDRGEVREKAAKATRRLDRPTYYRKGQNDRFKIK
jgi:hypothetical protein